MRAPMGSCAAKWAFWVNCNAALSRTRCMQLAASISRATDMLTLWEIRSYCVRLHMGQQHGTQYAGGTHAALGFHSKLIHAQVRSSVRLEQHRRIRGHHCNKVAVWCTDVLHHQIGLQEQKALGRYCLAACVHHTDAYQASSCANGGKLLCPQAGCCRCKSVAYAAHQSTHPVHKSLKLQACIHALLSDRQRNPSCSGSLSHAPSFSVQLLGMLR